MIRLLAALVALAIAAPLAAAPVSRTHVRWADNANIYEVNIRQYTPEGTIKAFETHLPRLHRMGVKILWIMPVQPIGAKNRKGTLGSYYSIRDYTAVNPEFGTMADFRHMTATAHRMGMKVILDWVANHTSWDNPWVTKHPEWYKKNAAGEIGGLLYDNGTSIEEWTDVVGLDYRQPTLWPAMIAAMKYWLREGDVDGFRCDVAMLVPEPFWAEARRELDAIKPVFMLAEADDPKLQARAFDMTYNWKLHGLLTDIAKGRKSAVDLRAFYEKPDPAFAADAIRMTFTSNHDINSWAGSDTALFGAGFKAFAVLAATLPGMPLIYGGQESRLNKQLLFFEKDAVAWRTYELAPFYTELLALKAHNRALWNGAAGGDVSFLAASNRDVLAFRRTRGRNSVSVAVNLSATAQIVAGVQRTPVRLAPYGYVIAQAGSGQ